MARIKSVSEAYSMQPANHWVGDHNGITAIGFVKKDINSNIVDMVAGWDKDGNIKFEWLADAVNIEYE
jgi:hypothetical protein